MPFSALIAVVVNEMRARMHQTFFFLECDIRRGRGSLWQVLMTASLVLKILLRVENRPFFFHLCATYHNTLGSPIWMGTQMAAVAEAAGHLLEVQENFVRLSCVQPQQSLWVYSDLDHLNHLCRSQLTHVGLSDSGGGNRIWCQHLLSPAPPAGCWTPSPAQF